jgi:hypothetical protein
MFDKHDSVHETRVLLPICPPPIRSPLECVVVHKDGFTDPSINTPLWSNLVSLIRCHMSPSPTEQLQPRTL